MGIWTLGLGFRVSGMIDRSLSGGGNVIGPFCFYLCVCAFAFLGWGLG